MSSAADLDESGGNRRFERLPVGELPNGETYSVPVMTITGAEDGPTLLIHTGMHGDEVLGAEVVRRVWRDIAHVRGRLLMVPSSNPGAMATRTRANLTEIYPGPQDMNRVFPGDPRGSLTERVAHMISDRLLGQADYCFDIHTPAPGGQWQPYVQVPARGSVPDEERERTTAFATAFGTEVIYAGNLFSGTIQDTARNMGVIASTVEFGEANRFDPALRDWGVQGVENLLRHVGMIEGEPVVPTETWTFSQLHRLRAERGGFWSLSVRPGDRVHAGDRLGVVGGLLEEEREVVTAPEDGLVVRVNNNALVGTGDLVVYIAIE